MVERFSLVAAAGKLATEFGITNWHEDTAMTAVTKCYNDCLLARGNASESLEKQMVLEQVRHFFQENMARFYTFEKVELLYQNNIPIRCAGFRSIPGEFYVYPKTFKDEICKGIGNTNEIIPILKAEGWLNIGKPGLAYKSIYVPSQGQTIRLYHFASEVIGSSDN